jgi:hypothetical protein
VWLSQLRRHAIRGESTFRGGGFSPLFAEWRPPQALNGGRKRPSPRLLNQVNNALVLELISQAPVLGVIIPA